MGDAAPPIVNIPSLPLQIPGLTPSQPAAASPLASTLDPSTKAALLQLAPSMPDANARDLADIVDKTGFGSRQRLIRYGLGAAGGFVLGVVVAKTVRKLVGA